MCGREEEEWDLEDCTVKRGFASRYGSHTAPKNAATPTATRASQSSSAKEEAINYESRAKRYPRFPGIYSSGTTGKTPSETESKKRRISFSKMLSLSLPRRRSSPFTFGNRLLSRTM